LVKITISGHPGSGTSTLVSSICDARGWSSLNGGDIFRQEAKKRNVSLGEFGKICANDQSVDRSLDDILKTRMSDSGGPEVMESRLCGWWAHLLDLDCIRIWLNVDESVRASRVVEREGIDIELALSNNRKRSQIDLDRFDEMYGLNPEDSTPYTHVIDASGLNREEVLEAALQILEGIE
jgi:predicted cytidylate kinase